ncbi:MAG: MarR family transcriptional regulator, partial [Bacteroidota bacterium]
TSSFMVSMKNEVLRPFNLSLPQFNILNILNNQYPKPSSVRMLADSMLDKTSNVSRIVAKLEDKGFIDKKPSKTDGRKVAISITELGYKIFRSAAAGLDNTTEFQLGNLTSEEVKTLNRLLDKTRDQ